MFNEQEQNILINNNVRKKLTLLNNKNKADFTINNSQLNDNNVNKGWDV